MKITSPEQLIKYSLAGHSVIIKTPAREILVDNDALMDLTMQDVIKLTQEQDIYTHLTSDLVERYSGPYRAVPRPWLSIESGV